MRQSAMLVCVLSIVLLFSGCCDKTIEIYKQKVASVSDANITQCKGVDELNLTKCVLTNYFQVKQERDSLRVVLEGLK
jgi:hypothetical protein